MAGEYNPDVHLDGANTLASGGSARRAMRISLAIGVLMLLGKTSAWWITGSTAILSDALESVIHVIAVGFAAWSLRLSLRPASTTFQYGLERVSFFSAGFEGAMIVVAAFAIIFTAVDKWMKGLALEQLGAGALIVTAASAVNGALGLYLIREGQRRHSIILEANGRHVLTDCWTSIGVIAGLCLVLITGWKPFDPICAILVALNILYSGGHLMVRSVRGLLDYADPGIDAKLRRKLDELAAEAHIDWHGLRFRETGGRLLVEVHLLFPYEWPLGEAHALATRIEEALEGEFAQPAEIRTHLEALEDHDGVHQAPHSK